MGLFSSKKNLCPVCGESTPRLFPTKVDGEPLCKECASKIELPQGALEKMDLNAFKQYLEYYDANEPLRQKFNAEYRFDVDGWSDELNIDLTHGLIRLTDRTAGIVFEASKVRSFRVMEDTRPLYEGSPAGLKCYDSEVPERLERIQPMIQQYQMEKREYDRMRQMQEMMDRRDGKDDDNTYRPYLREPSFNVPMPVEKYFVTVKLDDPYWPVFKGEFKGPDFGFFGPDVGHFLKKYEEKMHSFEEMANNMMRLIAPSAPVTRGGAAAMAGMAQPTPAPTPAPAAAEAVDVVAELRKYKELVDMGVLTEEEFAAKKRQLLGI